MRRFWIIEQRPKPHWLTFSAPTGEIGTASGPTRRIGPFVSPTACRKWLETNATSGVYSWEEEILVGPAEINDKDEPQADPDMTEAQMAARTAAYAQRLIPSRFVAVRVQLPDGPAPVLILDRCNSGDMESWAQNTALGYATQVVAMADTSETLFRLFGEAQAGKRPG